MLLKISLPLAIILGLNACSESNFQGGTKTAPKAADAVEEAKSPNAPATVDAVEEMKPTIVPSAADAIPATAEVLPTPAVDTKERCDAGVGAKILEQKITFAERRGCDYEADGVTRVNGEITTMKTTMTAIKLPPGEVCDMSLESDGDINFRYDDILIFSLDQYVLFSSTETIKPKFKASGDLLKWSKEDLTGFRTSFDGQPYCVGGEGSCSMPPTDTAGKISLTFPFASVGPMIQLYKGKTEVPLLLTATGDNDSKDCSHSKLDLIVKMKYVP